MLQGFFKSLAQNPRITFIKNYPKRFSIKLLLALLFVTTGISLFYSNSDDYLILQKASQSLKSFTSTDIAAGPLSVLEYLITQKNITDHYPVIKSNPTELTDTKNTYDNSKLDFVDYDREHIKYIYPEVIDAIYNNTDLDAVDWSKYAYVLYATSTSHMCNAMMICYELRQYNTRAELVLLVKKEFLTQPENYTYEHDTLTTFAKEYNITLKATEVIQRDTDDVRIWMSSYTKLMVFNETDYDRIIYMDSDALLTKGNLDELFFIPPCKMAVSTAYWHTKEKFLKYGTPSLEEHYSAKAYGFVPLTYRQRQKKLNKFIHDNIDPFLDPSNGKLPFTKQNQDTEANAIDEKNFYTNLYNELPNYVTVKEFDLTNIVMVIQPSPELFKSVLKAIDEKKPGEYDMELVQYHMFNFKDIIPKQKSNSLENNTGLTYKERKEETPEFLILPHQVYGTITHEVNLLRYHISYMADAHEQIFAHLEQKTSNHEPAYYEIEHMERPGDYFFKNIKYLHFSDAPIPKPWYHYAPTAYYMGHRARCDSHPDFQKEGIVHPVYHTPDCSTGKNWEKAIETFTRLRKDVCGLDLIVTTEDTYNKLIN